MSRTDYQRYLQSSLWRAKRQQRLAVANNRCEFAPMVSGHKPGRGYHGARCEAKHGLEVHHKHYRNLGREIDDDLEVFVACIIWFGTLAA